MIRFCEGEKVLVNGRLCLIKRIATFDAIEVQDVETGVWHVVSRADVHQLLKQKNMNPPPASFELLTKEQEAIMELRFEIIKPTLSRIASRTMMKQCAEQAVKAGLLKKGNICTIYAWKKKFTESGNKNSLAPPLRPSGGRGGHRLNAEVEELMEVAIEGSFLTSQKKKPTSVVRDVETAFVKENRRRAKDGKAALVVPCKKTVIARIKAIDLGLAEEKRYGEKSAKERLGIMKGHLQCGSWPWALGQMDHKQLRNVVIDGATGEPLGRPWLTAIIDTNSRIPAGFVLSMAKPSAVNIGLCLAMSMVQKGFWLNLWGFDQEDFPVFGKWGTVQVDNELKNEASGIIQGCKVRDIELEFRPLRNPQTGGFIESFFKTLNEELRNLPGYKSRVRKEDENYRADQQATFTLQRLTEAIALFIIKIYCNKRHSGLKDSPLNVYKRNLIDSGIGIPEMIFGDEARDLILDFMPYFERTIQEYGVRIFNTHYRSDVLEQYIKLGKEVR